jgi:ribosomal protein S18 acetylase RimI-like enzyme
MGFFLSIHYTKSIEKLAAESLEELFKSVEWRSGNYPNELLKAMVGSHSVVTAWEGNKLIGLINALSDSVLTAYFHYMLVNPQYQGKGIGKKMMDIMLEIYKGHQTKVLIAYPIIEFYEKLGFETEDGTTPMFISNLI